jgi:hypothetical protein
LVTVDDENKREVKKRRKQIMLESEPKLFSSVNQVIRQPAPNVTKNLLPVKDSRSAAVRKHLEGEENTAKQIAKVKMKKTEGAVTK